MSIISSLDFRGGRIRYDTLSELPTAVSLKELSARELLDEDLLQVEYPGKYILDVGWYSPGLFRVYVIKDFIWDRPLLMLEAKNLTDLYLMLPQAIKLCSERSVTLS